MLTDKQEELILRVIRLGMSHKDAAALAGIPVRKIQTYRARGRRAIADDASPELYKRDHWYVRFLARTDQASAQKLEGPLKCVVKGATEDPEIALKWLKTMRYEFNSHGQRLAREKMAEMYRVARDEDPEFAAKLKVFADKVGVL